jgi:hypothetical protein
LVQSILATIIGFLITLLLKLLILQILRKSWYGAFYRRKPAAVNIMNIVLECWSLGLSSGYIIGRIVKLLLVALFYIGRIDTPMLAPGVGWVFNRIPVDSFPIAFRKDILIHEAVSTGIYSPIIVFYQYLSYVFSHYHICNRNNLVLAPTSVH